MLPLSLIQNNIGGGLSQLPAPGGMGGFLGSFNPAGFLPAAGGFLGNSIAQGLTNDEGIISEGGAKLAGMAKGAGTGAAIGSIIPGIGTGIGAAIGGLFGGIFGKGNEAEVRAMQRDKTATGVQNALASADAQGTALASSYNIYGNRMPGIYANGGLVQLPDFKVEDQEVMFANPANPPMTDVNGSVSQISQGMYKFDGDKHSDPSGGIGVSGGDTPGFVFSNRLKADPSKYLKGL